MPATSTKIQSINIIRGLPQHSLPQPTGGAPKPRRFFYKYFSAIPEKLSILAYILKIKFLTFADMKNKILYTPTEIINRNPRLRQVWNAQQIGYLFKLQLVNGERRSRYSLVDEDDVLRLFFFRFPSLAQ